MTRKDPRRAPRFGVALALALVAAPARAFDVTSCGQTVPPGEEGVLTTDLVCPRLPEGNPPALFVSDRATLDLNGHSITAPSNTAVIAAPVEFGAVRMTVVGPGEITGSEVAIHGDGRTTLVNLNIHDNQVGVLNRLDDRRGVVQATNVSIVDSIEDPVGHGGGIGIQTNTVVADGLTVTGATFDGFFVRKIKGANVVASDCGGGHPICGGLGFGIVSDRVRITNLTAQNNRSAGVIAIKQLLLRDSTVTGNTGEFTCDIDVFAERRPILENTICGKSNGWHVCQNDSPSGAFLDPAN
jgi:hypothetical protein